jgi:hypothetical protein
MDLKGWSILEYSGAPSSYPLTWVSGSILQIIAWHKP